MITKQTPIVCPKCQGQGLVSKPPWLPAGIDKWTSGETAYTCDVCNGQKIIYEYVLIEET